MPRGNAYSRVNWMRQVRRSRSATKARANSIASTGDSLASPQCAISRPCETAKSWRSLLLDAELLSCHRGSLFSTVANRPVSLIEIAARLTVTGFAEHFLAGNLRSAGKLLAHYDDEEDFSLKKLRRSQYLRYTFGYRRQFALISASYARLQV